MTKEQLAELRKLAKEATDGPWVSAGPSFDGSPVYDNEVVVDNPDSNRHEYQICSSSRPQSPSDMEYIAAFNPVTAVALLDRIAELEKEPTTTPAAKWRDAGEADPHAGRYDCERHQLPCGSMTDDELANAVFLHDHAKFDLNAILAGAPSSIALLTAAKERIRWLSRRLIEAEQKIQEIEEPGKYFTYDGDNGFQLCSSAKDAKDVAQELLKEFSQQAHEDGEWALEVEDICWGVVLGKVAEIELPDNDDYDGSQGVGDYSKPVDYKLVESRAALNAPTE